MHVLSKEFLDILATIECGFALKHVRDMSRTYNQVQCYWQESVEVNPVPPSISDKELELNICQALSLTRHEVKPDDLQAGHRLKKKESVIVKFKCRKLKWKVLVNWKNLRNKSEDLRQLKFSGKLFISESMCHENHQLACKCCQLKNVGKIHYTWF